MPVALIAILSLEYQQQVCPPSSVFPATVTLTVANAEGCTATDAITNRSPLPEPEVSLGETTLL